MARITTTCPACGAQMAAAAADVGKTGRCAQCGSKFPIAAEAGAELPAAQWRAAAPSASEATAAEAPPPGGPAGTRASPAAVAAEWKVGDVILGLYEVKAVHKGGRRAVVYRVHHRQWDLDLAVKSPRAETYRTEAARGRFAAECQTWISLGLHPNIVTAYYVRTLGGIPRIFAEYVEGGSLRDWIESRRLYEGGGEVALERMLDVAIQFAWGLHHAHQQGIIHQDVKPANVMMTPGGTPKVTDFGLAGEVAPRAPGDDWTGNRLVRQGGLTPAFCSPEQARQQAPTVRSDMWSWAVSVLEMFAGAVTWRSGPVARAALKRCLDAGPSDARIPPMPETVYRVLGRLLRQRPEERPADMLQVAEALQRAYRRALGAAYDRTPPPPAELLADGWNNRAASLVDLARTAEAEKLFAQALQADPHQPEATYNLGLLRWRSGRTGDVELLRKLEEAAQSLPGDWRAPYLLGLVHLERGDAAAAAEALSAAARAAGPAAPGDLGGVLAAAQRRLAEWGPPRTLSGRAGAVACLSASADGRTVLSAGPDRPPRLWDVATGMPLRELATGGGVRAAWLAGEAPVAVCLGADGRVGLWDAAAGGRIAEAEADWEAAAVAVDAAGRVVLAGGQDGAVRLWDLASGRWSRAMEGHAAAVSAAAISADGRWAASASWDRTVRLWDTSAAACVCTFRGHEAPVVAVAVGGEGRWVLSGDREGQVRLWDAHLRAPAGVLGGHGGQVRLVCLSRDGATGLSGGADGAVRLWEPPGRRCLRTFDGPVGQSPAACLGGGGRWAAFAGADGTVRLLALPDAADRSVGHAVLCRVRAPAEKVADQDEFYRCLSEARVALDGDRIDEARQRIESARALPGRDRHPQSLELWHELTLRCRREGLRGLYARPACQGHAAALTALAAAADGPWAVSASQDGAARVWDIPAARCTGVLAGPGEPLGAADIDAPGRLVLTGGADRAVRLWDAVRERCLRTFEGHSRAVTCVAFGPCGRRAVSGGADAVLRVWALDTGRCEAVCRGHESPIAAVAVGPDGRWAISAAGDGTLRLWELAGGTCLRVLKGHTDAATAVALSADGRWALSAGHDKAMRLWDLSAGEAAPATFLGQDAPVTGACLSGEGRWALTAGAAKAHLWDLQAGRCLRTFEDLGSPLAAACFGGQGRWVLLAAGASLHVWEAQWEPAAAAGEQWTSAAEAMLVDFLTCHDAGRDWRGRPRRPAWTGRDFESLLGRLRRAGLGGVRPARVRQELEGLAQRWQGPPPLTL